MYPSLTKIAEIKDPCLGVSFLPCFDELFLTHSPSPPEGGLVMLNPPFTVLPLKELNAARYSSGEMKGFPENNIVVPSFTLSLYSNHVRFLLLPSVRILGIFDPSLFIY